MGFTKTHKHAHTYTSMAAGPTTTTSRPTSYTDRFQRRSKASITHLKGRQVHDHQRRGRPFRPCGKPLRHRRGEAGQEAQFFHQAPVRLSNKQRREETGTKIRQPRNTKDTSNQHKTKRALPGTTHNNEGGSSRQQRRQAGAGGSQQFEPALFVPIHNKKEPRKPDCCLTRERHFQWDKRGSTRLRPRPQTIRISNLL